MALRLGNVEVLRMLFFLGILYSNIIPDILLVFAKCGAPFVH